MSISVYDMLCTFCEQYAMAFLSLILADNADDTTCCVSLGTTLSATLSATLRVTMNSSGHLCYPGVHHPGQ